MKQLNLTAVENTSQKLRLTLKQTLSSIIERYNNPSDSEEIFWYA